MIAAVLFAIAWGADHPVPATGIALQTLAGLLAAIQLWANNASDAMVRWAAQQIARNRWRVAGLFDGTPRSLLLSIAWCGLGYFVIRTPGWTFGWIPAILAFLVFASGNVALMGSLLMYGSAQIVDRQSLPDGRAMTTLQSRITENDWIWPLVGLAFLLGGILQIAAA